MKNQERERDERGLGIPRNAEEQAAVEWYRATFTKRDQNPDPPLPNQALGYMHTKEDLVRFTPSQIRRINKAKPPTPEAGDGLPADKDETMRVVLDAFPLTERQQDLIFKSLDHCRKVLATEPGAEEIEAELTNTMRLFAERD